MKKKIAGWFLFDDCGECLPLHSKFCKRWDENIPGEQGNSLAQQDDRQGRIWGGEKKWNSTNSAPLLPADSSSFPSQEERKPRWKEEISGKEMKRALLARFFSCLTQLSDFAFKFKTADQTTRGTLYSCQEPRWDLSGTLLHARNKKLCLSPSFFFFFLSTYGATCKKEPNSWLGEGQDLWHFISWAGRGQQEEEENLIISFPK